MRGPRKEDEASPRGRGVAKKKRRRQYKTLMASPREDCGGGEIAKSQVRGERKMASRP